MSTQVSHAVYYSFHPKDTCIGGMVQESCCFGKLVLGVVAIIAVPLELIGRLFANFAIAVHRLFHTEPKQPLTKPIKRVKEQNLPIEIPPLPKPLTQDIRVLKARGTLYGQALGDTLGIPTEFAWNGIIRECKPEKLEFEELPKIAEFLKKTGLNNYYKFARDGWSDDTEQALAIGRVEYEAYLNPSIKKEECMAKHLGNWAQHGLNSFSTVQGHAFISRADPTSTDPLRKETSCADIGDMTGVVVKHKDFLTNPYGAALAVWKKDDPPAQKRPAANGAIMRTSILGSIYRNDLNKAKNEAIRYAKVTHADPRSIASAVALTIAIAMLHNDATLDAAMQQAETTALQVLWEEMEALQPHMTKEEGGKWKDIAHLFEDDLHKHMHASSLKGLKLCGGFNGYTFKCLGAAFYSATKAERLIKGGAKPEEAFRTVLEEIIFEGGDADTNAAAAGALLGAYLGEEAIPKSWRDGLHPQDKKVLEEALGHVEILAQTVS